MYKRQLCLLLVIGLSIYGIYNAKKIRVTSYHTKIDKEIPGRESMKIVLIADLHPVSYTHLDVYKRQIHSMKEIIFP